MEFGVTKVIMMISIEIMILKEVKGESMKKYAYSIHDWEQGESMKGYTLGGKIIGKVIVIAKREKDARVKIKEYIKNLNDHNSLDKLYYGYERYYFTWSKLIVLDIIKLA
jgi:hypothetical protein